VKVTRLTATTLLALLAACNSDPREVANKYVESGNKYFARGQYREASILYRRALNKYRRSGQAWYQLGRVNAKVGALPEARKDFSRAMELDPANPDAAVQLGDLDLAFYLLHPPDGRAFLADLKEITQGLLKRDPHSYDGLRFSGKIALIANDTAGAIRKFQEANRAKPDQPDLVLALVQTLFAARENEEGERLATELIDRRKAVAALYDALYVHYMRTSRPELAEQALQEKIARYPAHGEYLVQLAFHYLLAHRTADVAATIARLTSDPKAFPEGHLEAGDFYVRLRDYPAALAQYEAGQLQNPKKARTYRKKQAEVLATAGARDQAEKIVAGLLKDDSNDPEALALQASLRLTSGDPRQLKATTAELQSLIVRMPANATLRFNLGRAYLSADPPNLDKALEQLEAVLRIDPNHTPAKLAWAELQLANGEPAKAVEATNEVLSEDSTNQTAHLIRARGLVKMKELVKAREELETLLRTYPDSNDARDQLAELDFHEHRYQDAENGFRTLFEAKDNRGAPGLIKTKVAEGKLPEALELASEQLKRSPGRADYRLTLAEVSVAAGNYSAAAIQFQALIDKEPKSPKLYLAMGQAKLRLRDLSGALAAFQTARQLSPADAPPALALALLCDQTDSQERARREYQTVIRLEPDNGIALNNLAYLDAEAGVDLDQALAFAQHVQQMNPDDPDVRDTLALVYIRKNLTESGVRILRELVRRNPDRAAFRLHLAQALYQKGDRTSARRELEAALRSRPSVKEQDKIKELLAKVG
jgi:tetratricopeptide (TPR) repeat protein